MIEALSIGMIGAGYAAHLRARAILSFAHPRITIASVYSRNPDHARTFAAELSVPASASLEELCGGGANAVCIATPNRYHAEIARFALDHGLHVICEYPLALGSLRDAEKLARLADRRGLLLHVGQTMNYDADLRFILDHRKELGVLRLGYRFMSFGALGSWFNQDGFSGPYVGLGRWYVEDTSKGGWIVSSHYHGIQTFRRVFGRVVSVAAFDSTADGVSAASVMMRHAGGESTSIQWGMPFGGTAFNKTVVCGSSGSIETESGRFVLEAAGVRTEGKLPTVDTFVDDLRALAEEMEGTRSPRTELADSLVNLRVALAAERSAANGREVDL